MDCLGRPCPVPVIELARAIRDLPVGALVEVWSDDPAAWYDLPAWCTLRSQAYLGHRPLSDPGGQLGPAPLPDPPPQAQTQGGGRPSGPTAYLIRRTAD